MLTHYMRGEQRDANYLAVSEGRHLPHCRQRCSTVVCSQPSSAKSCTHNQMKTACRAGGKEKTRALELGAEGAGRQPRETRTEKWKREHLSLIKVISAIVMSCMIQCDKPAMSWSGAPSPASRESTLLVKSGVGSEEGMEGEPLLLMGDADWED